MPGFLKWLAISIVCLCSSIVSAAQWVLETNLGEMRIELNESAAPITTAHIKKITQEGFYNGTRFHRSIPGYIIQGGGYSKYLARKLISTSVKSEANNGLLNKKYSVAMARGQKKDSASTQFFINLKDNKNLNHRNDTHAGFGYTVFGQVISGFEVLEKMQEIDTDYTEEFDDIPIEIIFITKAYIQTSISDADTPKKKLEKN